MVCLLFHKTLVSFTSPTLCDWAQLPWSRKYYQLEAQHVSAESQGSPALARYGAKAIPAPCPGSEPRRPEAPRRATPKGSKLRNRSFSYGKNLKIHTRATRWIDDRELAPPSTVRLNLQAGESPAVQLHTSKAELASSFPCHPAPALGQWQGHQQRLEPEGAVAEAQVPSACPAASLPCSPRSLRIPIAPPSTRPSGLHGFIPGPREQLSSWSLSRLSIPPF